MPSQRNLRWGSGLLLFGYVAAHLLNHALGLVSLQWADAARRVVHALWGSLPGTVLLYGALLLHAALAFASLWERRSLRMPPLQGLRVALGFALPLLLALHVANTRLAHEVFALETRYAYVVNAMWHGDSTAMQLGLLTAAWLHGCVGLHLAWRARPGYRRHHHWLFAGAVLLPVLAVLGTVAMARELDLGPPLARPLTPDQSAAMGRAAVGVMLLHVAAVMLLLGARWLRARHALWRAGGQWLVLSYPQRVVEVRPGYSVLEASRDHGIAHMALCGGRARCSTCRIRVRGPDEHLPAPSPDEQRTLQRVQAPPGVRLACQLRPRGAIEVVPLFTQGLPAEPERLGREREVAVLFVDLRRWSGLAETQWPHDLVYVLDRYFATVGEAVREAGGVPNQFIGDSVMALFGLHADLPMACRQAVDAACRIEARMAEWNRSFAQEFGQPLAFGMGLHAGLAAVAEVGYQDTTSVTAVGEVVNTASRLQDHSKLAQARLVLSRHAATLAGLSAGLGEAVSVEVRGRSQPLEVHCVREVASLRG
jgi:adenylate cyclase